MLKDYKLYFGFLVVNIIFIFDYSFWHSTSAYAIAQAIEDNEDQYQLPDEHNPIYTWPRDLLLPTKIFFLTVSEKVRLERISRRTELTTQEHLIESRQRFRAK